MDDEPPIPVVFTVFELDLTNTPMGLELSSMAIWNCVVSLPVGVVMDDPVIVVFTKDGCKPKLIAFKSLVESVGNENCDPEIVFPADM